MFVALGTCAILSSVVCLAFQIVLCTLNINSTITGKKVTEHKMCVLIFSTTFVWNISDYKKNSARYDNKCTLVFTYSTGYTYEILTKLEFSRKILEKYSKIKFYKNSFSGSTVLPCGRTERLIDGLRFGEVNSRFSQFCEQVWKKSTTHQSWYILIFSVRLLQK